MDEGAIKALLARLVAFRTENPTGPEDEAAAFVAAHMSGLGFTTRLEEVAPRRPNVIGVLENGPGPTFAFNTHLDVVPAGEGWSRDPFSLHEQDGRLYGRGSCDAKGAMAGMLAAMGLLSADREAWSGTLMGVFVVDEESGSRGARAFAATDPGIDACVIGEPTGCTTVTAHKGSIRPVVRIHGKTAHSGTPEKGVNAILAAAPLLDAVAAEHERIKGQAHPLVGGPSLTVVRAAGGHADNVVPNLCELLLDRRVVPGEDEAAVKARLAELVAGVAEMAGAPMEIADWKLTTGGAAETEAGHPVVAAAQAACARHNGRETPLGGFQGACDFVHFREAGAQGVVLGPGSIDRAHQPDEYVPIDELVRSVGIYRDIAAAMLGGG